MLQARVTPDAAIEAEVATLLAGSGSDPRPISIRPCRNGGNNRVYIVETHSDRVIAKRYFSSPSDPRDRLRAEWDFLSYAVDVGIECVPRPIARDVPARLALYEFVDGAPLEASCIGSTEIAAAIDFVLALNQRDRSAAMRLGDASEACFSVAAHFALIDCRLAGLRAIEPLSTLHRDALALVDKIAGVWSRLRELTAAALTGRGIGLHDELPTEARCLSPSDFGYHNTLRRLDGTLAFIDFEYAGWDDPAKLVGDFLHQPAVPVDGTLGETFVSAVLAGLSCSEAIRERARILRPLFAIKWCCIMLNAFGRSGLDRRRFANRNLDEDGYKCAQLAKAEAQLQRAEERLSWPM